MAPQIIHCWFLVSDSAFKQQRLPAWQPILTAGTVLPSFFIIGIAFIPVGIGLLYFSDEVKEVTIDYTNCNRTIENGNSFTYTDEICANVIKNDSKADCFCRIRFNLTKDFEVKLFIIQNFIHTFSFTACPKPCCHSVCPCRNFSPNWFPVN